MVRRVRPNLRLENMKYHRPPSPTPEERLAARRAAQAEKGSGVGLSAAQLAKANKDLDALFADV